MPKDSHHDFSTLQLDPHLLTTPFGIHTNWHVITGAPCSGKSTLIELLAAREFQTVPESGRKCIEQQIAGGRTIDEIRDDMSAIQVAVFEMQLKIEHCLQPEVATILDGALPGSLAWYRAFGLNPNEILHECFDHRYASVFIFDPLPYKDDGARDEDAPIVDYLDEWLARDYRALGYIVVRVPVMPVQERLTFVLERLSDLGRV